MSTPDARTGEQTSFFDLPAVPRNDRSLEPVMVLRGAGVEVDPRRAVRAVVGVCLVVLAIASVILFAAGVNKNAQINTLRNHGVPVAITVTKCVGLLGGSGSNPAGYACTGTFDYHDVRYGGAIPGDTLYAPGVKLRAVTDPNHPALFSTASFVAKDRSSWRVFITPTVLLLVLLGAIGVVIYRHRVQGNRRPLRH